MAYMIEGGHSKTLKDAKGWLFNHPEASHRLLTQLTDVVIDYLWGQITHGAQLIQLFDSWAGELMPSDFFTYSFPTLQRIAKELKFRSSQAHVECVPLI